MLLQEAYTDWISSKTIFYNTNTNQISDNMNDLIEEDNIRFDAEGLRNYLDYGYSVYGQTPISGIKFLPPNATIKVNADNKLEIKILPDECESILNRTSTTEDTLEYFHYKMNQWVAKQIKPIIVPTSGGFDSRFLDSMIEDKEKIHAYSYGISKDQKQSIEVVYAKELCKILGITWRQIELGEYPLYMKEWFQIYSASTHAHGMYHMEFYNAIRQLEKQQSCVLSGIYGDLWAGNWNFPEIAHSKELINLAITHGLSSSSALCKMPERHELRDSYFEENKEKLKDAKWRILSAGRTKIILLSYLLRIPEYCGFTSCSPFLDIDIVSKMINLPEEDKARRRWQVEYFKKHNILIGEMNLQCDSSNVLDIEACRKHTPKALDTKLLGTIMNEEYVEKINQNLEKMNQSKLQYYNAYCVLYPIQKILELKEYGQSRACLENLG